MHQLGHRHTRPGRLHWIIVGLIVISTALFVTGVALEQSGGSGSAAPSSQQETGQPVANSGDPDGGHEGSSSSSPAPSASAQETTHQETVLGLNLETPWFIGAFILGWLLLLGALLRFGRPALVALILAALAAMILDVAEVVHQSTEARSTLAVIAALVAAAHLVLAGLAVLALVQERRRFTGSVKASS